MYKLIIIPVISVILVGCSQESYYSCNGTMENGIIKSMTPYLQQPTSKKNVNITLTIKNDEVYLGGDKSYIEVLGRGYIWKDQKNSEIFFTSTPYEDMGKQYERLHKLYPNESEFREQLDWENNHSSGGTLNKINKTLTLFKNDNTCYKRESVVDGCGLYTKGVFTCSEVKDVK